ncbi:MAG: hypothetical protein KGJ23_09860 [Euryarchaeota archaeon]|nr:hypothetical protein [Euryarchaeota archaeon]MDE1836908.1 hypothetical protein [Euryarchaeota archaeon]MDE1881486.1 hypothetical protein [Euryarchaeota archaeon]MDE2045311.1 hypothetical protein [Thermoplasmata archaeon]
MRLSRRSRRGVAGFLEEVPVLLIVVISFILFFSALDATFTTLSARQGRSSFAEQASLLLEDLLGYRNLTYQGQYAVFDASRVVNLTESNISWEYHPSYGFEVNITDRSDYPAHFDRVVASGALPTDPSALRLGRYAAQAPVDLWVSDVEMHDATIEVTVWE